MQAQSISYHTDFKEYFNGHYLEAVDRLHELDIYERGILRHIGSRISMDADITSEAVSFSFGVLATVIGMHAGTAQKKVKGLLKKGFIHSTPVYLSSYRGRTYRGPNAYTLTSQVFTGSPLVAKTAEPAADSTLISDQDPVPTTIDLIKESPPPIPASESEPIQIDEPAEAHIQVLPQMDAAHEVQEIVYRLIEAWQTALCLYITEDEKNRFIQAFIKTSAPEAHILERIEVISRSPSLSKRARDINMLFGLIENKYKNSAAAERDTMQALGNDKTTSPLIPNNIENKVASAAPSDSQSIIHELSEKKLAPPQDKANLPENNAQLIAILMEKLTSGLPEKTTNHVKMILLIAERCPFAMALSYYQKYLVNVDSTKQQTAASGC